MRVGQKNLDFVRIVPMTYGHDRNDLAGSLLILYKYVEVRWGRMLLASTESGICYAGFVLADEEATLADMKRRFSGCVMQEGWNEWQQRAWEILTSDTEIAEPVQLHLKGSDFQLRVWMELLKIPVGKTVSYKDIAVALHTPRACRAVGTAVGNNPVSVLIPCHRVVRRDGGLGGYHWGLVYKRKLLETEGWNQNGR